MIVVLVIALIVVLFAVFNYNKISYSRMIIKFFKWLKFRFSREWCYEQELLRGNACDSRCNGVFGGGPETDWLSYSCMDCRFWSPKGIKKK